MHKLILLQPSDIHVAKATKWKNYFLTFDPAIHAQARGAGITCELLPRPDILNNIETGFQRSESHAQATIFDLNVSKLLSSNLKLPRENFLRWGYWESLYLYSQAIFFTTLANEISKSEHYSVFFYQSPAIFFQDSGLPGALFSAANKNIKQILVRGFEFPKLRLLHPNYFNTLFRSQRSVNRLMCVPGVPQQQTTGRGFVKVEHEDILIPSPAFDWYQHEQQLQSHLALLSAGSPVFNFIVEASSEVVPTDFDADIDSLIKLNSIDTAIPIWQSKFVAFLIRLKIVYFRLFLGLVDRMKPRRIVISDIEGGFSSVLCSVAKIREIPLEIVTHSVYPVETYGASEFTFRTTGQESTPKLYEYPIVQPISYDLKTGYQRDSILDREASSFISGKRDKSIGILLNNFWGHNFEVVDYKSIIDTLLVLTQLAELGRISLRIRCKPANHGKEFIASYCEPICKYLDSDDVTLENFLDWSTTCVSLGEVSSALCAAANRGASTYAVGCHAVYPSIHSPYRELVNKLNLTVFSYREFIEFLQLIGSFANRDNCH